MILKIRMTVVVTLFLQVLSAAETIDPMYKEIILPKKGFKNIAEESSLCTIVSGDTTVRVQLQGKTKIFVKDCMFPGSGHGHSIAIGIGDSLANLPSQGVYLNTATSGWRTLRRFNGGGLPWLLDVNGDAIPELIIWQSFGDGKYFSTGTNGLIPYVYTLKKKKFVINKQATVIMIDQVLKNYQATIADAKAEIGKSWADGDLYDRLMRRLYETKQKLQK